MSSIPRHPRYSGDGDAGQSANAPSSTRALLAYWPVLVAIFAAGGTCATFAMQSARIDKLEARQAASDQRLDARLQVMDDRMRAVENGMATLLERTKPR